MVGSGRDVGLRDEVVYGTPDGEWAILVVPRGGALPPAVGALSRLGTVAQVLQVVEHAVRTVAGTRARYQAALAPVLGVSQQSVSLLLRGVEGVRPTNSGMAFLAWAHFAAPLDVLAALGPDQIVARRRRRDGSADARLSSVHCGQR